MKKLTKFLVSVVAALVMVIPAGLLLQVSSVRAQDGDWLSNSDPTLTNVVTLPSSVTPIRKNIDCLQLNYHTTTGSNGSGCFAQSGVGQLDVSGSTVLFHDTTEGVPIQSTAEGQYGTTPVPGQTMILSQSSAPIIGSYIHFYPDLAKAMSLHYDAFNHFWYTIDHQPSVDVLDKTGQQIPANILGTLSFASDGSWMVVDSPGNAFLRINLATLDVVPFSQSLNSGLDYSNKRAITAVSDDGHFVTEFSYQYQFFKVFDLTTCQGSSGSRGLSPLDCKYRDYWPYVSQHIPGFNNIYSIRFTNDDNINFDAAYNFTSTTQFNAARFTLTNPGGHAHNIDYLALGDSYISGQGTFQYKPGSDTDNNACHVSALAYPYIIGASISNSYDSVACSGAVTSDVIDNSLTYTGQARDHIPAKNRDADKILADFQPGYISQVNFVKKYLPRVVTLSIGGNDIGFSDILQACVVPQASLDQNCFDSYTARLGVAESITSLFDTLRQTYQAILDADPGVQLYVVGYPQIAAQGNCAANVHLSAEEITFSQQLINLLDSVIQKAATNVGARYVDIQNALTGHRLCEAKTSDIAINGVTAGKDGGPFGIKIIGSESFHPNVFGHQLLAQKVLQATNNFKEPMPPADGAVTAVPIGDPSAQNIYGSFQNNGPQVDRSVYGLGLPGVIIQGSSLSLSISDQQSNLRPSTTYKIGWSADSSEIGTATTDQAGNLNMTITPPNNISPGPQTVHVYGQDLSGNEVDIYQIVYVTEDNSGSNVPNQNNQCAPLPLSGQDSDGDGIDDVCDPQIGDPAAYGHRYPATASLIGNSVTIN